MNNLLKPDEIMNGLITNLIENCWREDRDNKIKLITRNEMLDIHSSLVKYDNGNNEIFGEIAKVISVPIKSRGHSKDEFIDTFSSLGFIIDDDLYAAAGGHFNYIYRGKGLRTLWFQNGLISECTIYCTIDEHGFQMSYEEFEEIDLYNDYCENFFLEDPYEFPSACSKFREPSFIVDKLLHINKYYDRAYYIEYLIDPPDVQIISDFSLQLRKEIWNSLLDLGKRSILSDSKGEELDLFKFVINFLNNINADIETNEAIDFFTFIIENQRKVDMNLVATLLNQFKESSKQQIDLVSKINDNIENHIVNKKEDILEIKPNFSGIGINFNEVYKRLKK